MFTSFPLTNDYVNPVKWGKRISILILKRNRIKKKTNMDTNQKKMDLYGSVKIAHPDLQRKLNQYFP